LRPGLISLQKNFRVSAELGSAPSTFEAAGRTDGEQVSVEGREAWEGTGTGLSLPWETVMKPWGKRGGGRATPSGEPVPRKHRGVRGSEKNDLYWKSRLTVSKVGNRRPRCGKWRNYDFGGSTVTGGTFEKAHGLSRT